MCQATGQGHEREQDQHQHPDVELTNIKLELTGLHCARSNSRGSRRRKQGRSDGQVGGRRDHITES